jgi:tripartite-type tricarboxylate transporter receptor subunit TctC
MIAPAGLPQPVLAKLAGDLQAAVRSPEFADKMTRIENEATASTPEEFQAFLAREIAKWKDVARAANIRIE